MPLVSAVAGFATCGFEGVFVLGRGVHLALWGFGHFRRPPVLPSWPESLGLELGFRLDFFRTARCVFKKPILLAWSFPAPAMW
jgi:hypothetical protein